MKSQRGFILILTTYIISVMSLLLITSMQHLLLYRRVGIRQELERHHFYQLEYITRHLANTVSHHELCSYMQNKPNKALLQVTTSEACSLVNTQYRYVIEDLGEYPCMGVVFQGQLKPTHHFRITVLAPITEDAAPSIMQVRVIKPSINAYSCIENTTYGSLGISSWRYL